MKKYLSTALLIIATVISFSLGSCSDDDNDNYIIAGPFYEFGKIKSYSNYNVIFNVSEPNSFNEIPLEANYLNIINPEELPAGTRVMASYNTNSQLNGNRPSETTMVQLLGMNQVITLNPVEKATEECSTGTFEGRMNIAPYRTGTYINILLYARDISPRASFECYVDTASLSTNTPEIYLSGTPGTGDASDDNCYPISINIDNLWKNQSYTAYKIHVKSHNYEAQEFIIRK